MTHAFTHRGQARQIVKHPQKVAQTKRGEITAAALEACPSCFRMTIDGRFDWLARLRLRPREHVTQSVALGFGHGNWQSTPR